MVTCYARRASWLEDRHCLLKPRAAHSRQPPPQFVMYPTNENQSEALIFTGVGSLFTPIAAVLLKYSLFAGIFAFFSAFALAVALRNARGTDDLEEQAA